jgi:NAD(P)-dependent dehydrogenase (short-subunit alcohol dehydrogenase family)
MTNSVLVTGTSTGLGLETAVYLAERGFEVYASMRDLGRRGALDEAAARRSVELHVLQLDITDKVSIDRAVQAVVERSGGIYGLINNAGIGLRGYFEDLSEEEIRHVFEVNVFGTMAVTRAVLPHMRAARRGRIVIITSVGGLIGSLAVSAYCATKFAQEGFGESLAQEVVPFGIYVSLVEPAIIKTERWGIKRGIAKGAQDPESPYYAWFRESERLADRLVETSPTKPVDVAKAVYSALTARRPKLRYMVGRRAGLVVALRRYLPGELFERFYFGEAVRRVTTVKRTANK